MNLRGSIRVEGVSSFKIFFFLDKDPYVFRDWLKEYGSIKKKNRKNDVCPMVTLIRMSESVISNCRIIEASRACNEHFEYVVKKDGEVRLILNLK